MGLRPYLGVRVSTNSGEAEGGVIGEARDLRRREIEIILKLENVIQFQNLASRERVVLHSIGGLSDATNSDGVDARDLIEVGGEDGAGGAAQTVGQNKNLK